MDSEATDKSNSCETSESTMDSSSINNNTIVKEGVKKVHSVNILSPGNDHMEVDEDKCFEKENGIHSEKENQNDTQTNNENATQNHDQSNSDEKDLSKNMLSNEESCVQNSKDESVEKNIESNSNEHLEKEQKSHTGCNAPAEAETAMDASSDKDLSKTKISPSASSEKPESTKNDVRPVEKDSAFSESIVSGVTAENSSKTDSSDKDTKDKPNVQVPNDDAASLQDAKGKETNDSAAGKETTNNAPSDNKSESTKKEGESTKKKKSKTCEECGTKKGLKFQVLFKGKTRFLCSDTCFKNFKSKQMQSKSTESSSTSTSTAPVKPSSEPVKCGNCQKNIPSSQGFYPVVGTVVALCSEECIKKYNMNNLPSKSCSQCKKVLENPQNLDVLTWETMVFCNEDCLGKFQSFLGSHCTCCQSPVPQASLGKYSVCFGADIRQFCSCNCLDDFKKNLKVCSFCQTDLSAGIDSFLAPVGDKGQFKDFCSQNCMERYEVMNNISKSAPQSQVCTQCKKQGTFKIQAKHSNDSYALCSDLCVAGFRCARKIKDKMCDTCYNFFDMAPQKDFSFKFDGQSRHFCTKACMTLFVLSHRKIVACASCKVKKYNFDMIEKIDANNQSQIFCSLNCLSLYRVSVNATSSKSVRCDHCGKNLPAQYHLTMSDGSVRNFCTYNCVIVFQNQYTNVCTLTTSAATRQTNAATSTSKTTPAINSPVISNVVSLAPATPRTPQPTLIRNLVPPKLVAARPNMQPVAIIGSKIYSLTPATGPVLTQNLVPPKLDADQQPLSTFLANNDSKSAAPSTVTSSSQVSTVTNAQGQQVIREVIVKPPAPKSQKNKSVACKPIMISKSINVKPPSNHKAVQTDDAPKTGFIPIPIPIYIPLPLHMYSRPVPCPVPFPVPIPVPIFVPVPKDTSNQEKRTPAKIFEDIFARSEKPQEKVKAPEENCNSIKDVSQEASTSHKEKADHSEKEVAVNDEPGSSNSEDNDEVNEVEDEFVFKDNKSHHHGKRHHHHHHKNKSRKRSRTDDVVVEEALAHIIPPPPPEEVRSSVQSDQSEEAPCLKVP